MGWHDGVEMRRMSVIIILSKSHVKIIHVIEFPLVDNDYDPSN